MDVASWVGGVATVCSATSFVPQAWKVIRERRTQDLSVGMYVVTVVGFALWTSYGVMIDSIPIIASNSICLVLSAFILVMVLLPRREKDKVADAIDPTK